MRGCNAERRAWCPIIACTLRNVLPAGEARRSQQGVHRAAGALCSRWVCSGGLQHERFSVPVIPCGSGHGAAQGALQDLLCFQSSQVMSTRKALMHPVCLAPCQAGHNFHYNLPAQCPRAGCQTYARCSAAAQLKGSVTVYQRKFRRSHW